MKSPSSSDSKQNFLFFIIASLALHVWVFVGFLVLRTLNPLPPPPETQVTWVRLGSEPIHEAGPAQNPGNNETPQGNDIKPEPPPVKPEPPKTPTVKTTPTVNPKDIVIHNRNDKKDKPKPTPEKPQKPINTPTAKPGPKTPSANDLKMMDALARINSDLKNEQAAANTQGRSGGGNGGSATGSVGGSNSECGSYRVRIKQRALGNWKPPSLAEKPPRPPKISFMIGSSGQITSVRWLQKSGNQALDTSAQQAIDRMGAVPAPPTNCEAALRETFVVQFGK